MTWNRSSEIIVPCCLFIIGLLILTSDVHGKNHQHRNLIASPRNYASEKECPMLYQPCLSHLDCRGCYLKKLICATAMTELSNSTRDFICLFSHEDAPQKRLIPIRAARRTRLLSNDGTLIMFTTKKLSAKRPNRSAIKIFLLIRSRNYRESRTLQS